MRPTNGIFANRAGRLVVSSFLCLMSCSTLRAQRADDGQAVNNATVQLLLARIEQLEARVSELEAKEQGKGTNNQAPGSDPANVQMAKAAAVTPSPASPPVQAAVKPQTSPSGSPESDQSQPESVMTDRMDLSKTLLNIRGFGDVSFHHDTQQGDASSFSLGQLDLFVTSDIADKYRFLSEIVFEGGPDNIYGTNVGPENTFGVDVERYLLQYSHNDYLNISVGRVHTAIGYYNTAYHHSSWMQTTTDRPFLFEFEDRGGILPVHTVGVSANGMIPSKSLGLHYVAELGNGRESRSPLTAEPVQNQIDDTDHKAFNLALFARPESLHGFQTGFSFYRDVLVPANTAKIGESILAAHAILIRPKFEWLSEALLDRHTLLGTSSVFHTPGFYSQMSRQFGSYRPYFRYEYLNVAHNEPVFPDVALRHGPILGLRYDATESVALKFQYNYTFLRNQPGVNGLTGQVGFTF
jgi:hypothetical protein